MSLRIVALLILLQVIYVSTNIDENCQFRYVEEPIASLDCNYTSQTIRVRCSVLFTTANNNPTISYFEWLRSNTTTGVGEEETFVSYCNNTVNNTGLSRTLISNEICIDSPQPDQQYRCRPMLSNGSALQFSQAIVIPMDALSSSQSCQRSSFSSWSCRCADINATNEITTSTCSNNIVPTLSSLSSVVSSLSASSSKLDSFSTPISLQDSISTVDIMVSPMMEECETRQVRLGGLRVFLPIISVTVLVIIVQLIIQIVLLLKYKSNLKTHTSRHDETHPHNTTTTELNNITTNHNVSSNDQTDVTNNNNSMMMGASYMTLMSQSSPGINYVYPNSVSPVVPSSVTEVPQTSNEAIYDDYEDTVSELPHQYAPLSTGSMDEPNLYESICREDSLS